MCSHNIRPHTHTLGGDKNIYSSFLLQVVRGILDVNRHLDGKLSQAEKQQYETCEEEDVV